MAGEIYQSVFNASGGGVDFNARNGALIAKSDVTVVDYKSIYVGTGGDVAVRLIGNPTQTLTFKNVPDGTWLPVWVVKVLAATTASDMIGIKQA
jgi:hypothetical protein